MGRFTKDENNIITDKETDLEWSVGPTEDTNWFRAVDWVDSLGDGWRLPTLYELRSLYEKGEGLRNISPLFEIPGWQVWSVEVVDSRSSLSFTFDYGFSGGYNRGDFGVVFAVREKNN